MERINNREYVWGVRNGTRLNHGIGCLGVRCFARLKYFRRVRRRARAIARLILQSLIRGQCLLVLTHLRSARG